MLRALSIWVLSFYLGAATAAEPDAYQHWRATLFDTLERTNDANDYVALYLLSGHDTSSEPYLTRAFAVGKTNAKALWLVAIASPCPSECEQSIAAARDLVKADPDNALAWLTLAYVAERDAGVPKEIRESLKRAAKASRLHDYGFDLMKTMIATASRLPISAAIIKAAPGKPASVEEFQLQAADGSVTVGSHVVMDWIDQGCASHADPLDAAMVSSCAAAAKTRNLGDSLVTLGVTDAGKHLRDEMRTVLMDAEMSKRAKMRLETYAAASNERDFIERLAKNLSR